MKPFNTNTDMKGTMKYFIKAGLRAVISRPDLFA